MAKGEHHIGSEAPDVVPLLAGWLVWEWFCGDGKDGEQDGKDKDIGKVVARFDCPRARQRARAMNTTSPDTNQGTKRMSARAIRPFSPVMMKSRSGPVSARGYTTRLS